jgi:microcystin degradation protein MlrC
MTASLPADLAEIQARAARVLVGQSTVSFVAAAHASATDVPALVAELAEHRAAPQLTATAAREALRWMRWTSTPYTPAMSEAEHELRAIAEQANR